MTDITQNLHELISKHLSQNDLELVGIVPIPAHTDRMVRLRTLQEIIEDFEETPDRDTTEFLVQLKPKKTSVSVDQKTDPLKQIAPENIYLTSGKLNIPYLVKNAEILLDNGDFALARNIYTTILRSGEYTSIALHRLGRCFEAEGKLAEAQAHYEESIVFQPSLECYNRLSSLLVKAGKDLQAAEVFERAAHLKDLSQHIKLELYKNAGSSLMKAGNTKDAERVWKLALDIDPSNDEICSELGSIYFNQNKVSEAKRAFRDAISANPKNPKALEGLGSCCYAEGDKKAAHDYFVESLEMELDNSSAMVSLVKTAFELRSYAIATKMLERYIQVVPPNPSILYSLAGFQFHLGRILEAKNTTLKILDLQPTHSGAKELLGIIEKYAGNQQG